MEKKFKKNIHLKEIEHYDKYDNQVVFWCVATDVPQKYVEEVKSITKDNYNPDCFGFCIILNAYGFSICKNEEGSELYYVNTNGSKHWMKKTFSEDEAISFFASCLAELLCPF